MSKKSFGKFILFLLATAIVATIGFGIYHHLNDIKALINPENYTQVETTTEDEEKGLIEEINKPQLIGGTVKVTATAEEGYKFWAFFNQDGELLSLENPFDYKVVEGEKVVAKFYNPETEVIVTVLKEVTNLDTDKVETTILSTEKKDIDSSVELTAEAGENETFVGFYNEDGEELETETVYNFTANESITITMKFTYTEPTQEEVKAWGKER